MILATPSHESARLLRPTDASLADDLGRIEHSGTAIVSVAYRRRQIRHKLDGMGFVVPAVERSPVLACSFSSQKYAHRAPEGTELLRIFVGGARHPELAEMEDRRLVPLVLGELATLLGIDGEPIYTTSPTGRARCRSITWATRTSSPASSSGGRQSPVCAGRQRLSGRGRSPLHP